MIKPNKGIIIWITGLPGSGKTTLAKALYQEIKDILPTICIDGDQMRKIMGGDLGYAQNDRLKNAYRIVNLAEMLVQNQMVTICSTVSLFHEIHDYLKKNFEESIVVFIDTPLDILIERDQKQLYSSALAGTIENVRGINQSYDIPYHKDYHIVNDGDINHLFSYIPLLKEKIFELAQS